MFKVETSQSIDRELIKKSNISFPDLIVKSLKLIGFIDIQKHGNKISFRHDFKDTTLESFQRRYGSGYLIYKIDQKNATINIVTENSIYLTLSIFGNAFVFFAANYQFIFNSNENLSFILIFNTILILLNVYGIWTTKRRYKTKHLELLEWIDGKINEISRRKKND